MNWEMLGAIGEIVGALGVIATLGYLAVQLRGNTRELRMAAERDAFDGSRIFLSQISGDADLARIVRTGLTGLDALDPDEATRFGTLMLSMTYDWMRLDAFGVSMVSADLLESNRRTRRDLVATPGYQQWFEIRKHWLSDEFQRTIEREIAAGSGGYIPYGRASDAG